MCKRERVKGEKVCVRERERVKEREGGDSERRENVCKRENKRQNKRERIKKR